MHHIVRCARCAPSRRRGAGPGHRQHRDRPARRGPGGRSVSSVTKPSEQAAAARPSPWNLPNALTVARIFMVPVFAWLLLSHDGEQDGWRIAATACFVAAILTDNLDGAIARRRGLVTDFGKLADPIADKALTGTAFVGLSLLGELSWWVTGVVLGRELLVTAVRFVVIRYGVIAASRGGKLKTSLQAIALAGYILPVGGLLHAAAVGVMTAAVIVTVATGVEYLVQAVRVRRTGQADVAP
ncbi:MAG: CDP-diacylglycerol--glycerol-3-phosphate 3-phosphatidyltransferase [Propionibacteriales bacterium]|nr:CDP-diacylglycerol--glycerol-3-phosphate 3-phosphatidyltransferase [Propionibacteriales bacterium]